MKIKKLHQWNRTITVTQCWLHAVLHWCSSCMQTVQAMHMVWFIYHFDRVKRIWYFSPMRAAKIQASLRIRAVSPEPSLLTHTNSESRGTFRQKARSLALLNGWACAVKICHDGMLEETNSLDGAHLQLWLNRFFCTDILGVLFYSFWDTKMKLGSSHPWISLSGHYRNDPKFSDR